MAAPKPSTNDESTGSSAAGDVTAQAAPKDAKDPKDTSAKDKAADLKAARRSGDPARRAAAEEAEGKPARRSTKDRPKAQKIGNPGWFVPVMLGLMILGLLWVVTFYVTSEEYPVASWGRWNLGAGFALMMAGFAMTTRWK